MPLCVTCRNELDRFDVKPDRRLKHGDACARCGYERPQP